MRKKTDRIGEIHRSSEGYDWQIVEYNGNMDVKVELLNSDYTKLVRYSDLNNGSIRNPFHPSVHNIGFMGAGRYMSSINSKHTKCYQAWKNMLDRCYCSKYHKKQPSYIGTTTCKEWYNFQNFADWYNENYISGYYLDKDILGLGNKIYSAETCIFIPNNLNSQLTTWSNDSVENLPSGNFQVGIKANDKKIYHGVYPTYQEALIISLEKKKENTINLINELLERSKISKYIYDSVLNFIEYKIILSNGK